MGLSEHLVFSTYKQVSIP